MDDIYELYFLKIFDSIIFTLIIYKTLYDMIIMLSHKIGTMHRDLPSFSETQCLIYVNFT